MFAEIRFSSIKSLNNFLLSARSKIKSSSEHFCIEWSFLVNLLYSFNKFISHCDKAINTRSNQDVSLAIAEGKELSSWLFSYSSKQIVRSPFLRDWKQAKHVVKSSWRNERTDNYLKMIKIFQRWRVNTIAVQHTL